MALYSQVSASGQPSAQRSVAPGGAFSGTKKDRLPKEATFFAFAPANQATRSTSWIPLAITNECDMREWWWMPRT